MRTVALGVLSFIFVISSVLCSSGNGNLSDIIYKGIKTLKDRVNLPELTDHFDRTKISEFLNSNNELQRNEILAFFIFLKNEVFQLEPTNSTIIYIEDYKFEIGKNCSNVNNYQLNHTILFHDNNFNIHDGQNGQPDEFKIFIYRTNIFTRNFIEAINVVKNSNLVMNELKNFARPRDEEGKIIKKIYDFIIKGTSLIEVYNYLKKIKFDGHSVQDYLTFITCEMLYDLF